jgi:hypothetical protein
MNLTETVGPPDSRLKLVLDTLLALTGFFIMTSSKSATFSIRLEAVFLS